MPHASAETAARRCLNCGGAFRIRASRIARGEGKYCSQSCYHEGRRRPLSVRFWEKVRKTRGCWIWTGATKHGKWPYGNIIGDDGAYRQAHRVSWELHKGAIADGLFCCHRCDQPLCVNPAHLFLGTASDNSIDMVRKGRVRAKLVTHEVREIRRRHAAGQRSHKLLAQEYGVSTALIHRILSRQIWRGVE